MTRYPDLFAALAAPLESQEVKLRAAASGRQVPYITARTAMNRLDSVLGPENWWDDYVPLENSVICKLTLRLPDGSTVTKCDAGGYAGMADSGDDDKSGFSDAFKRAASKFGVARYLYRDGVPHFVREREPGTEAPALPAKPSDSKAPRSNGRASGGVPRTGKAFFAWVKEQDEHDHPGLFKELSEWAKRQEFPDRMVNWKADQVTRAHAEACRRLDEAKRARSKAFDETAAD